MKHLALIMADQQTLVSFNRGSWWRDFIGVTCTVTFAAGSGPGAMSTPSCDITINNDNSIEQDETFSLSATILNVNGQSVQFTAGGDSASATILDDDGTWFVYSAKLNLLVSNTHSGWFSPSICYWHINAKAEIQAMEPAMNITCALDDCNRTTVSSSFIDSHFYMINLK